MATEIDYSNFYGSLREYAQEVDKTQEDQRLSAEDIEGLSFAQKRDLYLKAMETQDSTMGVKPYQIQTLFDPSNLFSKKQLPQFELSIDGTPDPNKVELLTSILEIINGFAARIPEFAPQTSEYAWPAEIRDNKITVMATNDIPGVMDRLRLPVISPGTEVISGGSDYYHKDLDGITISLGRSEKNEELPNEWMIIILIDLNKLKTFSEILATVAHEIFGHVFLSLVLHDSVLEQNYVLQEKIAYTRSVRFLEAFREEMFKRGTSDPKIAPLVAELDAAIQKEKDLLAPYDREKQ